MRDDLSRCFFARNGFYNTGLTRYSVVKAVLIQQKVVNLQGEGRIVEVG